jgi:hypothetical protein
VLFDAESAPLRPCGVFGAPVAQVFDPALGDVTELSVDASGAKGLVRSTTVESPRGRMVAVELAGGTWRADLPRVANLAALELEFRLAFARISPTGDMFASELPPDDFAYRVYRYAFSNAMWVRNEPVTPQLANESTFAGGEVEVDAGSRQITDAINAVHDARSAALAVAPSGRLVLAYAATKRGETTGSRLYLVEKIKGKFDAGERIEDVEVELDGGEELVEPWLAPGCEAVYFRRTPGGGGAGAIYMAPRLDPPAIAQ